MTPRSTFVGMVVFGEGESGGCFRCCNTALAFFARG
jgi:hypothetical protein